MASKTWSKNRIGRTITITYCRGFFFNAQNQKIGFFERLWGEHDLEKATKLVSNIMGTNRVLVEQVEYVSLYCSMPLSTFVDNCDVKIYDNKE